VTRDELISVPAERNLVQHALDGRRRLSDDSCEEGEVLAHGEIPEDGRRLGHVAEARAKLRRACGMAEHLDEAAGDLLNAHDRPHHRRLAAPARS
jgi:hypothetical protein